jgi:transcriptional regulator with GAF, ATPase, and Fis domain
MKKQYLVPLFLLCAALLYHAAATIGFVPYFLNSEDVLVLLVALVGITAFMLAVTIGRTADAIHAMNQAVESTLSVEKAGEFAVADFGPDGLIGMLTGMQRFFLHAETGEELLNRLVIASAKVIKVSRISVMLYDEKSGELYIHRTMGWNPRELKLVSRMRSKPGEGIAGRVFLDGNPIIVNRTLDEENEHTDERYKTGSYVSLALKSDDRIIGVINLTEKQDSSFTDQELELLTFMLNEISLRYSYLQSNRGHRV